ncbi:MULTISPECIES: hypothetical protein [unclassified Streptomyces]|uniref:hypothetical protein n=1 Tax=unclassified Streptomyces TaxID=2593676 RepID=UPI003800F39D
MNAFRVFFEGHAAFFAVVVPIAAIAGSYFAGVRGAKIQAKGGRVQAAAAREAAEIAAEAQRVAALWTIRQVQIAEFIHSARELVRLSLLLYRVADDDVEATRDRCETAYQAMSLRSAEIRLIAPKTVVEAGQKTATAARAVLDHARQRSPVFRARRELTDLVLTDYGTSGAAAHAAIRALDEESGDYSAVEEALSAVPGLSARHVSVLSTHCFEATSLEALSQSLDEVDREFGKSLAAMVDAARELLKSEDDVAPTVPEQRRRWWRHNSAASSADSA